MTHNYKISEKKSLRTRKTARQSGLAGIATSPQSAMQTELVTVVLLLCCRDVFLQDPGELGHVTIPDEVTFVFLRPVGLKVTILEKDPKVKLITCDININEKIGEGETGRYSAQITSIWDDVHLSFVIPDLKLKDGDVIYYKIMVRVHVYGTAFRPNKHYNNQITVALNETTAMTTTGGISPSGMYPQDSGELGHVTVADEATFVFLRPIGLQVFVLEKDPKVKLVTIDINVNQKIADGEKGRYSAQITSIWKDVHLGFVIPDLKLKEGDVIYYKIMVRVHLYGTHFRPNKHYNNQITVAFDTVTTTTTTTAAPSSTCNSPTLYNGRTSSCPGDILLDRRFDSLDSMEGWKHQVSIGGDHLDDEFVVFMKDSHASWLEDRRLFIKPSLLEDKYNESFVRSGDFEIEGCTSDVPVQCRRKAFSYLILPPVTSARLRTKDKITFRYGIVEIRAKLPQGKWIVPELWLVPVDGSTADRVVMGMARGNMDDSEFGWKDLEACVIGDGHSSSGKWRKNTPWTEDFHTFKVDWRPGQMQFFVDDQEIHRVSSSGYPILNKEVYISLGVHVAGHRDFPDNVRDKPWRNTDPKRFHKFWDAKNSWYPTWNALSALQVERVKISAI